MPSTSENNKRIAKNTLMLYIRMFIIMGVTLYTSRVVLRLLGVTDYGIYNVVGGVVTMLAFLSNSLSGATSRFIMFELGCGDKESVEQVFRCSASIFYILSCGALLLAETIGIWFVRSQMNIPLGRETAAMWVYQCSVLTFIISLLSIPYNSLIIAHERMSVFAYISIFDCTAKLLVVFLLSITPGDKLIVYALLLLGVQIIVRMIYAIYCKRNFPESNSHWLWKKQLSRKIFSYAGWTLNGNLAVIGYTQGINVLLNLFFGPTVNAARAIAVQVQTAITSFFAGFLTAVRPQIIKSYAQNNLDYTQKLVISASKYAFFLILFPGIPLLRDTDYVLRLWLTNVPAHTATLTRLTIIACMNYTLAQPTIMAIHATGDLRKFQIVEGTLLLTVLTVAYLLLKFCHVSPESVLLTYVIIEFITQFARVWIVYPKIRIPIRTYFTQVLFPIGRVCIPILVMILLLPIYNAYNIMSFATNTAAALLCTAAAIYILGFTSEERRTLQKKIKGLQGRLAFKRK